MKKRTPAKSFLDDDEDEERELLESLQRGEWKPSANQEKHRKVAMEAARNYFRKDKRINIRLSDADLVQIKLRAASEGMPYQTLVASVLHKFVTGQLS